MHRVAPTEGRKSRQPSFVRASLVIAHAGLWNNSVIPLGANLSTLGPSALGWISKRLAG